MLLRRLATGMRYRRDTGDGLHGAVKVKVLLFTPYKEEWKTLRQKEKYCNIGEVIKMVKLL